MIVVVSCNTALDRIAVVPGLRTGAVLRVREDRFVAGGKGGNVARFLAALGHPVTLAGVFAGAIGRAVEDWLRRAGVRVVPVWVPGETRICDVLVDPGGGHPTVVNGQGPLLTADGAAQLVAAVRALLPAQALVLAGSLPPGAPADLYASLVAAGRAARVPVFLDTSGEALVQGVQAAPTAVKVNRAEFAALAQDRAEDEAARDLLARGVEAVAITDGDRGARLYAADQVWYEPARPVPAVNPVGCGDAFLAGLVDAWLARPDCLREALEVATRVAAAKAARLYPEVRPEDARGLA